MNDSDLFHELHEGMREQADRIDFPLGMIAEARHAARRRTAGRVVLTGVPVVAVAGVAAVLAFAGRSAAPQSAGSGPAGPNVPASSGLTAHMQDTAYVVRRVRTHLAHLAVAGAGQVLQETTTQGNGTAGYPTSNNIDWMYIDPRSGIAYQRSVDTAADGTYLQTNALISSPSDGGLHTQVTSLDPASSTYFTSNSAFASGVSDSTSTSGTQVGIRSTEQQIEQALADGQVTREGSATVGGQSTIELSVSSSSRSSAGLPADTTISLYVNARTDQPVREVDVSPDNPGDSSSGSATTTLDWLPRTAANIARTKVRIPANYTEVSAPKDGYWTRSVPLTFVGY